MPRVPRVPRVERGTQNFLFGKRTFFSLQILDLVQLQAGATEKPVNRSYKIILLQLSMMISYSGIEISLIFILASGASGASCAPGGAWNS